MEKAQPLQLSTSGDTRSSLFSAGAPCDVVTFKRGMMHPKSLDCAATDLTLFFGAESFIHQCKGETVFDPDGEACLATLIDKLE